MKRIYFLFLLSTFLVSFSLYRWWALYQPRTGPIGDGTISTWVYISIFSSLLVGIFGLVRGILILIHKRKSNRDNYVVNRGGSKMMNEQDILEINKAGWNKVANQFFEGSFDDLQYGIYGPTESELNLLGEIRDRIILEVGCGSGHTLEYLANRGASELYGVDLSSTQIETAKNVVSRFDIPIHLIESPMEDLHKLPEDYFDIAVSMFALGWTVNLEKTLQNIFRSLKSGGFFVFTWEHPIHSLLEYVDGKLLFRLPYANEQMEIHESWRSVPIVMNYRKLSTYINALINTGFILDKVIEEARIPDDDNSKPERWYSAEKARMIPPSFTIKCHKP